MDQNLQVLTQLLIRTLLCGCFTQIRTAHKAHALSLAVCAPHISGPPHYGSHCDLHKAKFSNVFKGLRGLSPFSKPPKSQKCAEKLPRDPVPCLQWEELGLSLPIQRINKEECQVLFYSLHFVCFHIFLKKRLKRLHNLFQKFGVHGVNCLWFACMYLGVYPQ